MLSRQGPVVSVITAAYNAEQTIAQTLASCLAQTFHDFELLVVDDGSTDRTAAIVREYATRDQRVRLLPTCNGGTASARNVALSQARGPYAALLDSDDLWMPDYLSKAVDTLDARPEIDIVTFNAINTGGSFDGQPLWPTTSGEREVSLLDLITVENLVCIMSVFRREVWEGVGGFDPSLRSNEDYDYWLRAARAGFRILAEFTPRCFYRRRPDSVSADESAMLEGIVRVLSKLRTTVSPRSEEMAAIDRQLVRFHGERMEVKARLALRSGDPTAAISFLKCIRREHRSAATSLLAAIGSFAPSAVALLYKARQAVRGGAELRRSAAHGRPRVSADHATGLGPARRCGFARQVTFAENGPGE